MKKNNTASYKNRIVDHGECDPAQLLANPFNFRKHPKNQQNGMNGVLSDVGWVQSVIVNQRTNHLIDGHLRVSLALRNNEKSIPVVYVDLSENEEKKILATLDYTSSLADIDKDILEDLIKDVQTDDAQVLQLLSDMLEEQLEIDVDEPKQDKDDEPQFIVSVHLNGEGEQRELYERLKDEGYQCKLIM